MSPTSLTIVSTFRPNTYPADTTRLGPHDRRGDVPSQEAQIRHAGRARDDRDDAAERADEPAEEHGRAAPALEVRPRRLEPRLEMSVQPRHVREQPGEPVAPEQPPDRVAERRTEGSGSDHRHERLTPARRTGTDDDETDLSRDHEVEQEGRLAEGEPERDELEPRRAERADVVEQVAYEGLDRTSLTTKWSWSHRPPA